MSSGFPALGEPELGHGGRLPPGEGVRGDKLRVDKGPGPARAESPGPRVRTPPRRPGTGRSAARALEPDAGAAHSATRPGRAAAPFRAMGRLLGLSLLGIALGLVGERLLALR